MPSGPYPYMDEVLCPCCWNPVLQGIENHLQVPLTVILRLEAATSRLEDMVPTMRPPSTDVNGVASLPEHGLTAPGADARNGPTASPRLAPANLPPAVDDFDALINGDVKTFVNMSEEIGGLVAEQVRNQQSAIGLLDDANGSIVSCCTSSFRCGEKVPDCYYESKETRHSVPRVHGSSERSAIHYGCG